MNISANLQLSMIHINGVQTCPTWLNGNWSFMPHLSRIVLPSLCLYISLIPLSLAHPLYFFSHLLSPSHYISIYLSLS